MNYGGCQMGGYQYGMGIADLFSGVNGLNSIWNFNNCGFSNFNYGCGCGNSNNALGWGIGYTITNILGNIGLSWIASARANKAAEKKAEKEAAEKQQQSVENAFKCVFGNDSTTLTKLLEMDAKDAEEAVNSKEIVNEYNADSLNEANTTLNTKKSNLTTAQQDLTKAQDATKKALAKCAELSTSDSSYSSVKDEYDKAVAAEQEANKKVELMQKEVNKAQEEVDKIKKAQEDFTNAQRVLIEKIAANDKVKEANFKSLADDADGYDRTVDKKVKQYNQRYKEENANEIRELKQDQEATIDDLRAIAHLAMDADNAQRINYKKQFDDVMKKLNIEVDDLPDALRKFYKDGLSKYVEKPA